MQTLEVNVGNNYKAEIHTRQGYKTFSNTALITKVEGGGWGRRNGWLWSGQGMKLQIGGTTYSRRVHQQRREQ